MKKVSVKRPKMPKGKTNTIAACKSLETRLRAADAKWRADVKAAEKRVREEAAAKKELESAKKRVLALKKGFCK